MGDGDGRRLEAVDGLRGVAALAVVISHVHLYDLLGVRPFATHAYMAVDLFFMISGFILGRVYGRRLAADGGFNWFLRARLTRLGPLYLAGVMLGLLGLVMARLSEGAGVAVRDLTVLLALALAFLPWVFGAQAGPNAFPLNPPSWSLSLEMWGNLLYAAVAPRLSHRVLGLAVAVTAVVLIAVAVVGHGVNFGWRQGDFWIGAPRFVFAFSVGLVLQRLAAAGRLRLRRLPDWAPALVLAAVLTLPVAAAGWNGALDLVILFAVFPALIAVAVSARSSTAASGALGVGARLSYPLYAVHAGVVALVGAAVVALHGEGHRSLAAACALGLSLAVAWAAERFFDRPVRAWLARRPRRTALVRQAPAA